MTELLSSDIGSREFSRTTFLKGGGALVVAIGLPTAFAAGASGRTAGAFPIIDAGQLDSWLTIDSAGKVTVRSGRTDQGQGKHTSYAQIVAEELDVRFDAVTVILGDTSVTPDQGKSTATNGISSGAPPLRNAAAQARQTLVGLAAAKLGVPASQLTVLDGVVSSTANPSQKVTYGELIGGQRFNVTMTVTGTGTSRNVVTTAPLKDPTKYKVVGQYYPRVDIPAKVIGTWPTAYNIRLPGMLHGRVVMPPTVGAQLVRVKGFKGGKRANVQLVVKNNFVAVVSSQEWAAIEASRNLDAEWNTSSSVPNLSNIYSTLRSQPLFNYAGFNATPSTVKGNVDPVFASSAGKTISARYDYAYNNHGMIGPSIAVASWDAANGSLAIWCGTQAIDQTRAEVAKMLGLSPDNVRIIVREASSAFGRLGIDDAAGAAAILTKEIGKPVRVQWMRDDEHGWAPHQPGYSHDLKGTVDSSGRITAWYNESWGPPANMDLENMLPWQLLGTSAPAPPRGNGANAPNYADAIPNMRIVANIVQPPVRNLYMRSPGSIQNDFVKESFMDELAALAGADAIDFRLNHLRDPAFITVLNELKAFSRWETRPSATTVGSGQILRGRGVALTGSNTRTVGNVAEVEINRKTGALHVTKISVVASIGTIVTPDGTKSQIEGGTIMGISRATKEEVRYSKNKVTSTDWVTYPIVRFKDVPYKIDIKVITLPNSGIPAGGIGEPSNNPQPAAIGNAIFDATGVRMRAVPFTPSKVRAALKAAGK
jgi:CO/xanthine dehydrogenase Mo-binding subunit